MSGLVQLNLLTILLRVFSASAAGEMVAMGSMEASLEEEEDVFPFPRLLSTSPPSFALSALDSALSKKGLTLLVKGLERPIVAYFPPVVVVSVNPFVAVNGLFPVMTLPPPLISLDDESLSPFCRNGLVLLLVNIVSF